MMPGLKRIAFSALVLAFFAAAAFAQESPTPRPQWFQAEVDAISATWAIWGPSALLAVTISFSVVALAYMIAIAFDMHSLRNWAKAEFYQSLASLILVLGLVSMTQLMMSEQLFGTILGHGVNPFAISDAYLNDLQNALQYYYRTYYFCNFPVEALSTFSIYINAVGIDVPVAAFLRPLRVEPAHIAGSYITQSLMLVSIWKGLLEFFKTSAFATFLPLGVFLRIFPPTRGAGGLLIAIAIGLFLVFPTMIAFLSLISQDESALANQVGIIEDVCSGLTFVDVSTLTCCNNDAEYAMRTAEDQSDPSITAGINSANSYLPGVLLKVLFYPIIVMAATITFIKVLAPLLGADITEIGRGLVRLI